VRIHRSAGDGPRRADAARIKLRRRRPARASRRQRLGYDFCVRLRDDQARAIVTATRELAGQRARVRLFGSRLRDDVRGGDIDFGGASTTSCKHL
jgi:hypothetical protein